MSTLVDRLSQLENAQLVRRVPGDDSSYLFKHALTQDAAYESLLMRTRREIHRRVAEAFEQLYAENLDDYAAILAAHYEEAGDDGKTAVFAARAGDLAANISAYTEASAYYASSLLALSRLPDDEQNRRARVDAIVKRVSVAWGIDSADQNLSRLYEAEALAQTLQGEDGLRLARVRYWMGRIYSYRNEHREAALYYQLILNTPHNVNDPELSGLAAGLGGRTFFLQGYFRKAAPLLEQAIPYLEQTQNWAEWVLAKVSLAISLAGEGRYREGRAHGDEAIAKAVELNDRTSIASAYGMTARVEFMAGDLRRMLEECRVALKEAEGANPLVLYMVLGFTAWTEGRLGLYREARATMARADAITARFGTRLIFSDWFAAARAEIEVLAGDSKEALRLAQEAVREAQRTGGIFSEGIAERVWGIALGSLNAGSKEEAEAHLRTSLELLEEGAAEVEAARTHLAWGRVLQGQGDAKAAREHFERAAAGFEAAGLAAELEEARQLYESAAL